MPERAPETNQSTDFLLGQITAQLREMIHSQNNTNAAVNGLEASLGKRIDTTNNELKSLAARVQALEAANERREGASSIVTAILKSPAIGWLVGAAITAWALLTGKVHV